MRRKVARFVKTAMAVAPLVVGAASPAYGCLVLPENQGTSNAAASSDQIECGPVGCGPNAPWAPLQAADGRNQGQGFSCDPMCVPGNPEREGGPTP